MNSNYDRPTITFYSPRDIPKQEIIGYQKQMRALVGMAFSVVDPAREQIAIIFGFPGTGKSAVPFSLARLLSERFNLQFSLIFVRCDQFEMELASKTKDKIEELDIVVEYAEKNAPALICFNDIESLVPDTKNLSHSRPYSSAIAWFRKFLLIHRHPMKALVLATSSFPNTIHPSILRSLTNPVYFQPPELDVLEEITKEELGVPQYRDVARLYTREMNQFGLQPMGAYLIRACRVAAKEPQLITLSDDHIVRSLIAHSGIPPSVDTVNEYEEKHAGLIRMSLGYVLPWWNRVFDIRVGELMREHK